MNVIYHRLGNFIEKRCTVLIILGILLLIPLLWAASDLELKSGNDTFVSSSSQVYKDYERFTERFSDSVIVAMLLGEDLSELLQPENFTAMGKVETEMGAHPHAVSAIGPVFTIKQVVLGQGGSLDLLQDTQQIIDFVTDSETGGIRPEFAKIFPDNQHAFIAITIDATISKDEQSDFVDLIRESTAAAGFTDDTDIIITGTVVVAEEMKDTMTESMTKMIILAIILMLVILLFVFKVRGFFLWRWLPLAVVLLGIIYTFGFMGLFNVPITAVTMAVFPILIGLGIDYSIQFHNRYDEKSRSGQDPASAARNAVTYIGPSVAVALTAACLGFAALFFSAVPMIRDFALTLILGVISCYILSHFFLLSILYRHDRTRVIQTQASSERHFAPSSADRSGNSLVDRALLRIAPWIVNHPIPIVIIALLITCGGLIADSKIDTETEESKFLSQDIPAIRDLNTLQDFGGGLMSANLFVESADVTDPELLEWMLQFEEQVKNEKSHIVAGTDSVAHLIMRSNNGEIPQTSDEIKKVLENIPASVKSNFITGDFTAANVVISVLAGDMDLVREVTQYLRNNAADPPGSVGITVTGVTQIMDKLEDALTSGRQDMTALGIIFVFLGLLLLLRLNVRRAIVATAPITLVVAWSSVVMYLADIKYTPLTATLGALIIGIGVEFTLLLMMRYYEERAKGMNVHDAMNLTIVRVGRPVYASAITSIGGFGALLIADDFLILRDFGIVTMINIFFALVAALVVMPPVIVWFDTWRESRSQAD